MSERSLGGMLEAARLIVPDEFPELVSRYARGIGAHAAAMYLVDRGQRSLCQIGDDTSRVAIEGTVPGRVFAMVEPMWHQIDGSFRFWLPVLDGLERLGVLALDFPEQSRDAETDAHVFAALVAELVTSKQFYGDIFEMTRRTQPMTVAAEIQWSQLPPLTCGTTSLTITGTVEPAYEIGGDAFDYAINGDILHAALLDGMGHGLSAATLVSVALATYRNARRARHTLLETAAEIDRVITGEYDGERFVTGWLGQLDAITGELHFINAGHPSPLLLRNGRVVKELVSDPLLPFGFADADMHLSTEPLEPGDRVLVYTDGVVEARGIDGEFFGQQRLQDFIERECASGHPSPEILRRMTSGVLLHQSGALQDDSTMLLIDWFGPPPGLPQNPVLARM